MSQYPKISDEFEQLLDEISPIEWMLRRLDDARDARAQHELEVHYTERKIMDELGYKQEQIVPLDIPL